MVVRVEYEKLSRCSDSATCEPLDASAKLRIFSVSGSQDTAFDPGRLRRAGSQDTDLSCHVSISTFFSTL